jgi:hypothetical protein
MGGANALMTNDNKYQTTETCLRLSEADKNDPWQSRSRPQVNTLDPEEPCYLLFLPPAPASCLLIRSLRLTSFWLSTQQDLFQD